MVLSKSKPNKASHMRLKDRRTTHWGRGPASAALWDRGPAPDVLGGPALPLLGALEVSAVTCPCSGSLPDPLLLTGVWSSDSPRGWGSEPVALPGVLRHLGEGGHAPGVPVLSVWAQTVLQGSCQSLHLVPPRGVPTKAQLHQGLNYLRDEGLLSFTFLSWLIWANAHLTTFIVFSP